MTDEPGRLTEADATRLTKRIQLRLETIADNVEAVVPMIEEAKAGNAHEALGFASWPEYVVDKFGGVLGRLSKAERVPLAELLRGQGLSTRAIGVVVGASKSTVDRDLRGETSGPGYRGVPFGTPAADLAREFEFEPARRDRRSRRGEVATVTGLDGKKYPQNSPPPKQHREPKPRDYDQMVDQGINLISVALVAASSRKWTPNQLSKALLYFHAQSLADHLERFPLDDGDEP